MSWYATRSIYFFGIKESGVNIYEERIVCFEAMDFDEANVKAALESRVYSDDNGFKVHDEQFTYRQDGDPLIDGYELWSELYESELSLNDFYQKRYKAYLYTPDPDQ